MISPPSDVQIGRPGVESSADADASIRPPGFDRILRFELTKLLAQWRTRVLLLVICLAPGVFVALASKQSSLPADTVFGRQMAATGWAGVLVVLSFCGTWALPLLVSLVAADIFAAEDRLGTWRHLVVAARSVRRIFAAKALAGLVIIALMLTGIVASALWGGLLAIGNHPLLGLDGHTLTSGQAAVATMSAWLSVVLPTLAFAGSACSVRSPSAPHRSDCCFPRCCPWRCRCCSSCHFRSASGSRCPATASSAGAACSPTRPSSPSCSPGSRSAQRGS